MPLSDMADVLVEVANTKIQQIGLPGSSKQRGVICMLFKRYWEDTEGEVTFAQDADWFRHQVLKRLWGHSSLNELDMACHAVMIDELGDNFGGQWQLSERGYALLDMAWEEFEGEYPTQAPLL